MTNSFAETLAGMNSGGPAPVLASRSIKSGTISVTLVESCVAFAEPTVPTTTEDQFVIAAWSRQEFSREIWVDSVAVPTVDSAESECISFLDLRRSTSVLWRRPFSAIIFCVPWAALNDIGGTTNGRIEELDLLPGAVRKDGVIAALSQALLPLLKDGREVSDLFTDHVLRGMTAHIAESYGGVKPDRLARGGLAPWQQKRLIEMIDANLAGDITLSDMAQECGLSTRHLGRAFSDSLGLPPYQWLVRRRVEKARSLLRDSDLSLSAIARTCGFADQSHLTRVFTKSTAVSPAVWRRQVRA